MDELRASASALDAARVVHLGYADSGHGPLLFPDPPDRVRFARADVDEAAARLACLLRDEHAEVLLSYDPQGGYGQGETENPDFTESRDFGGDRHTGAGLRCTKPSAEDKPRGAQMSWYLAVLKNYAGFTGRARRKEYWWFVVVNLIILAALSVIGRLTKAPAIGLIYALAVLVPFIAVEFRRLHDTGRPGQWWLLNLVPIAGQIVLWVFFYAADGDAGDNKYGPDPKADRG